MSGAVHTPLVERLRATQVPGMLSGCCDLESLVNPDGPEAANTINELLEALESISEGHLPDQPAASSLDEYEWAVQHVRKLRKIARAAIARAKGETQ